MSTKQDLLLLKRCCIAGCLLLCALIASCSNGKNGSADSDSGTETEQMDSDDNGRNDSDDTSASNESDSNKTDGTDSKGSGDDSDSHIEAGTDDEVQLQPNWVEIAAKGASPAENGVDILSGFESIFVTNNDVLLARVAQGNDDTALWRSTDKGATWQKQSLNLVPRLALQSGRIIAFEVPEAIEDDTETEDTEAEDTNTETDDPDTAGDSESEATPIHDTDPVSSVVTTGEDIQFLGERANEALRGAMYSDDDGATWHPWQQFEITSVAQQTDGTVYITAWNALYVSHDDGATVTPVDTPLGHMDAIEAAADGWLFVHTGPKFSDANHTLRSFDGGINWSEVALEHIPTSAPDGSLIFGLSRSIDMGDTWDYMAYTFADDIFLLPTGVLLGGKAEHFYASNNYGDSWARMDSPRPDLFWASWKAVAMLSDGTILASGFGGINDDDKLGLYYSEMFKGPDSFGRQITSHMPVGPAPDSCFDGELTEDETSQVAELQVDCGGACGPCDPWWYMSHGSSKYAGYPIFVSATGRLFEGTHYSDNQGKTWSFMDGIVYTVLAEYNGTLYGRSVRWENNPYEMNDDVFVTLYASHDNGDSWMSLGELEAEGEVDKLMVDATGTMYLKQRKNPEGTLYSRSNDGGWTWQVLESDNGFGVRWFDLFVTLDGEAVVAYKGGDGTILYRMEENGINTDEPVMTIHGEMSGGAHVTAFNTYLVNSNGSAMVRITDSGPEQIELPGQGELAAIHEQADGDIVLSQDGEVYYAPQWRQWENRPGGTTIYGDVEWAVDPAFNRIYACEDGILFYTADLNTW